MKITKMLIVLNILFWSIAIYQSLAYAEAIMQKVCHDDAKTKKEVCKTIKTHKKVEGTVVPEPVPAPSKSKFAAKKK
jgi:hypothetical protein